MIDVFEELRKKLGRKPVVSYNQEDAYRKCIRNILRIHHMVIAESGEEREIGLEDALINPSMTFPMKSSERIFRTTRTSWANSRIADMRIASQPILNFFTIVFSPCHIPYEPIRLLGVVQLVSAYPQ